MHERRERWHRYDEGYGTQVLLLLVVVVLLDNRCLVEMIPTIPNDEWGRIKSNDDDYDSEYIVVIIYLLLLLLLLLVVGV